MCLWARMCVWVWVRSCVCKIQLQDRTRSRTQGRPRQQRGSHDLTAGEHAWRTQVCSPAARLWLSPLDGLKSRQHYERGAHLVLSYNFFFQQSGTRCVRLQFIDLFVCVRVPVYMCYDFKLTYLNQSISGHLKSPPTNGSV